jgi:PTH1 family peptidyl-tRNA hydrolase
MKLFVGLGNPGKKYQNTRHNVGFMVIDAIAEKVSSFQLPISSQLSNLEFKDEKKFNAEILRIRDTILVKPQTFMNDSGDAVSAIANFYKIMPDDIYIIHDDLDIKLGEYKIQKGKGPKVHNGVNSVEEKLGVKDFWRVRVGIENRMTNGQLQMINEGTGRIPGEVYTLQEFEGNEENQINKVIEKIVGNFSDL